MGVGVGKGIGTMAVGTGVQVAFRVGMLVADFEDGAGVVGSLKSSFTTSSR